MIESAQVMTESAEHTFPMWLKVYEKQCSQHEWYRVDPKVLPALVAYMNYEISAREAAKSFAPALLERYKQLADAKPRIPGKEAPIPRLLVDAATGIFHHKTQDLLVKLISALQQEAIIQEDQLKVYEALRSDHQCASKLPGVEEALGEFYFRSRGDCDRTESPLYQANWICINALYARLTAAKLLRYEWAAVLLCEDLIKALEESREPHSISIFLCAAAQHVIYATPDVRYYCETRVKLGNTWKWDEWKEGFQRTREIPGLSKDAHRYSYLAVAAMERMEREEPALPPHELVEFCAALWVGYLPR